MIPHVAAIPLEHTYQYDDELIPVRVWTNIISGPVNCVVFLGTVQTGKLAEWTLAACPPNSIVIEGAPHWLAKTDGSDIPEFMTEYTFRAFEYISKHFAVDNVHIIAESQAAPGAIELCLNAKYSPYIQGLTLLQPLGLNAANFGSTDGGRIKNFKRRIAHNAAHQIAAIVSDPRLRHNHRLLLINHEVKGDKGRAQYASGLRHDALPMLARLYQQHMNIRIICGDRDRLFPANEIAQSLSDRHINISVETVSGVPHSPLATQLGQRLLQVAFERMPAH